MYNDISDLYTIPEPTDILGFGIAEDGNHLTQE